MFCEECEASIPSKHKLTRAGKASTLGKFCQECVGALALESPEYHNSAFGELGVLRLRMLLTERGFVTAIPTPDLGEDLWFSKRNEPVFRSQVKTFAYRKDRFDYHCNLTQSAFQQIRDCPNARILFVVHLNPVRAKSLKRSSVVLGCIEPQWFTHQSWFDSKEGRFDLRFKFRQNGKVACSRTGNDRDSSDCTEMFGPLEHIEDLLRTPQVSPGRVERLTNQRNG